MQRGALESISEAVLAIAAEREVEPVLRRLVHSARELAGARYAAKARSRSSSPPA